MLQVLVPTMHQTDHNLLETMNIQTPALIGNQCDRNEVEEFTYRGNPIKWLSFRERGVGLNRNNLLMRATADYLVLADDDLVLLDGYEEKVLSWFSQTGADVLVFNLIEEVPGRYVIPKVTRLNGGNYGRYGAARVALRREAVHLKGISFNLSFGGGAPFSNGEDSLFLRDCIRKGLKVVAVPDAIAKMTTERESTWFAGWNEKFFFDKGVLYGVMYPRMAKAISLYHCLRHWKRPYGQSGWRQPYRTMCEGIDYVKHPCRGIPVVYRK